MAVVRLVALAAVAAVGCRASEAGPSSGLAPPTGWKALPSLAAAASDAAKAKGVTVEGVEAWGDTARGCYGAWLAIAGNPASPDALAKQLVSSVTIDPALAGITVRDTVNRPAGAGAESLSLAFERAPYRGRIRALLASSGKIALLACFWNEREPVACEGACAQLLGGMP